MNGNGRGGFAAKGRELGAYHLEYANSKVVAKFEPEAELLSETVQVERIWPWVDSFLRKLHVARPRRFFGSHLLVGSDYGGNHASSPFKVYGFVIADADASPDWPASRAEVRRHLLRDNRRMSFKNLNDGQRRLALIPFLKAADSIEGSVVTVAVSKRIDRLVTSSSTSDIWRTLHGLKARWDERAFEEMCRIALFFSLLISAWSREGMNVSWLTDEDNCVANPGRLEDFHQLAARMSSIFLNHCLGEFMMNTPSASSDQIGFEDFLSIADLAVGMVADVLTLPAERTLSGAGERASDPLKPKSQIIADWFWDEGSNLTKCCIVFDKREQGQLSVSLLESSLRKEC